MSRVSVDLDEAKLFWAALDLPPRAGREAALAAFEDYLPLAVERVHAVFARSPDGRTIGCGLPRTEADSLVIEGVRSARPAAVPAWLETALPPGSFQLLVGEFAPQNVRRWRAAAAATSLVGTVLLCILLIIGAERRRVAAERLAADARTATATMLESCGLAQGDLPAELRLGAALREARALLKQSEEAHRVFDAAPQLAAALKFWPRELVARTELVRADSNGVTISTRVADSAAAARLAESLRHAPGLTLDPPQLAVDRDGVGVQLRLRAGGGAP